MTPEEAASIEIGHSADARALYRKTKVELRRIELEDLRARGIKRLYGGPASKDEYIASILEMRYPIVQRHEAIHVLYHTEGRTNSACNWCIS